MGSNFGLKGGPEWRTIKGGSACYIDRLAAPLARQIRQGIPVEKLKRDTDGVTVCTPGKQERFDGAIVAVHSDQALSLLANPTQAEREVLGSISYLPNIVTLHTDQSLLPRRKRAWASWNSYLPPQPSRLPMVTYWMNCLQRLHSSKNLCVTLNREVEIDPTQILGQWTYAHPVINTKAIAAQRRRSDIQGDRRTWYCGAYWGYGFHEDGVKSAADVANSLGATI